MYEFSEGTKTLLKEGGWYPGRQIDPEPFTTSLLARGFEVNDAATRFFAEFGGISFRYPFAFPEDNRLEATFDVRQSSEAPENIEHWTRFLGKPLCLIGAYYYGDVMLMMCEEGKVYGGTDCWFALYGNSGADAIEGICINREPREIDFWEKKDVY